VLAISFNHGDIAEMLLARGARVDQPENDTTALN
jgi:hypothetical protein